jgi:hypothetical protein
VKKKKYPLNKGPTQPKIDKVLASTTVTKKPQPQYEVYGIASMPYRFSSGNSTDSSDIFEKCRQRKRKEAVNKKKKNTKMTKKQTAAKKK